MSVVLVTGHRGYIGSRLLPELARRGHRVLSFYGNAAHLDDWQSNIAGEIPGAIVHMASLNDLRACEQEPDKSFEVNYISAFYAGVTARSLGAKLVFTTTTTASQFNTIYDQDRGRAEVMLRSMRDLDVSILRLSTVYGDSCIQTKAGRGVINYWIGRASREKLVEVYRDVAEKRRDYVYVGDVVDRIIQAIDAPSSIYDICTGDSISVLKSAVEIANLLGAEVVLTSPQFSLYDVELRDEIIRRPLWMMSDNRWVSFSDGIRRTIRAAESS